MAGNRTAVLEDKRESYYHERMRDVGSRYAGFDEATSEAAVGLLYTYDVFHQMSAKMMAEFGLSKSTLNILILLRHGPDDGMQLHDLGSLLLVSRANITGLIDHLEEKNYVRRVVDINDRRARFARITEKGELLLDEFMPVHFAHLNCMMKSLTTADKKLLVCLLKKMRHSFAAHSGECCHTKHSDKSRTVTH